MFIENCFWSFWENWLNYYGTASRKVFWTTRIFWWVIDIIFFAMMVSVDGGNVSSAKLYIVMKSYLLIIGIPMLALMQRRLNDTNMTYGHANALIWAYVLLGLGAIYLPILAPFYGILYLVLFILCLMPTGEF